MIKPAYSKQYSDDVLAHAQAAIEAGVAVVVLRCRDKRPEETEWSSQPRMSWSQAKRSFSDSSNLGIRLGEPSEIGGRYALGLDLDVRKDKSAGAALDALEALVGDPERLDRVCSGSGGASRHYYFCSDKHFRPKKLAHSETWHKDASGKKHWDWEIELGGTGKQFVLPPSIHPITRQPYTWETEVDWENLAFVPSETIESWLPKERVKTAGEHDEDLADFLAWFRKQPPSFSKGEVEDILDRLADHAWSFDRYIEDREGWLKVGFALHNWSSGGEDGYEQWCSFSAASTKFDEADSRRVWDSMAQTRTAANPVTMRTLKIEADRAHRADDYGLSARDAPDVATNEVQEDDFRTRVVTNALREQRRRREEILGTEPRDPDADFGEGLTEDQQTTFEEIEIELKREARRKADEWITELDRTDSGQIKNTPANVALIVAHDPRLKGVVGYNDFTHEVMYRKAFSIITPAMAPVPLIDKVNGDLWSDAHDGALGLFLATRPQGKVGGYGIKVAENTLSVAVETAARKNRYHPVRDYLKANGRRWDGVSRMDSVFIRYLGCRDRPYYRDVCRLTLVAAVNRIMNPGSKWDFTPVLEGLEGTRKSTFIRILAKDWFGELHGTIHDRKMMVELMQGKWMVEMAELSAMRRTEVNVVKGFMTTQSDKVRLAYNRRAEEYPRQCVFIGTTNDETYLASETGNRRFWPIKCEVDKIDTERLKMEVDQLWAEAFYRWREMRSKHGPELPLYLSREAATDVAFTLQSERKIESGSDVIQGEIERWLETPAKISEITGEKEHEFESAKPEYERVIICSRMIWDQALGFDLKDFIGRGPAIAEVNAALRRLKGWQKASPERQSFPGYGQQRALVRCDASKKEIAAGYRKKSK